VSAEPAAPETKTEGPADGHAHDGTWVCPNCSRRSDEEFCPRCGQQRTHDGDLSLTHAWHHLIHETLHLDGRIFGSIKLLFTKPGQLTLDFLEGRRQRHVHPLRLFIVFSAIFFLFSGGPMLRLQWEVDHAPDGDAQQVAPTQILGKMGPRIEERLRRKAEREGVSYDAFMEHQEHRLHIMFKAAFIAAVVANGLWLALLFRRQRRYVAEHMVLALHVACFGMSMVVVADALQRLLGLDGGRFSGFVGPIALGYFVLAARRVYGERGRKLVVVGLMMMLTALVFILGALGLFIWRLLA